MHHQIEQVLNGPTYVTIFSSQGIKTKNWANTHPIISETLEVLLVRLLMGKGLVTVFNLFNIN
jgi:hypothetical protein